MSPHPLDHTSKVVCGAYLSLLMKLVNFRLEAFAEHGEHWGTVLGKFSFNLFSTVVDNFQAQLLLTNSKQQQSQ